MSHRPLAEIRNLVLCGHGSAGKSSLVDQFLMKTGAVKHPVSVDAGTSVCDADEIEKTHKYSVESHLVHFEYGGKYFQVLDTPGYPDFIGQTIGSLRAVETAVIVVNAHSGIEVNTRRVFHEAGREGLGRLIVINKLDTDNIDFPKLLDTIRETFGHACVPLNVPIGCGHDFKGVACTIKQETPPGTLVDPTHWGTELLETVIEHDAEVMARYFEGTPPTEDEVSRLIVEAVADGSLVPILCTSAKSGVGVPELLDALLLCALPPDKLVRRARAADGSEVEVRATDNGHLVAQVFKTRIDPFVQKLSYFRVYSGTLKKDDTVHASSARKNLKLHQLLRVQGTHTEQVDDVGPGYIIAVAKAEDLHTGTSLGDLELPPLRFPTPMSGLAVAPKTRGDEGKLSVALHKIVEEDQTIRLDRDPQTHELVMTGMSDLHLSIIREKLKRRDKVEVETKEPKIPYRETIQQVAEGMYRHKKQTGGRGQFGEVHIRMHPLPEGAKIEEYATKERFPSMREVRHDPALNFLWVDSIVGGSIPNNFLPAVEKGFRERMEKGVIAGYRVQNIAVEVHFGKHHPVDSSEAAFKTAGSMAFRNVFLQAKPTLLEPIVTLHVTVPTEKLGDINSDMSGRRGRVLGMDSAGGGFQTVTAECPLAEVTTYARALSSLTGGQGSFTMEFARYDVVPPNVVKEIVDKAQMPHEEEEE